MNNAGEKGTAFLSRGFYPEKTGHGVTAPCPVPKLYSDGCMSLRAERSGRVRSLHRRVIFQTHDRETHAEKEMIRLARFEAAS